MGSPDESHRTDGRRSQTRTRREKDRIWFDDTVAGFGLRVRSTGVRSWIFQYKLGRKTRRLVIGHAPAIKVAEAGAMLAPSSFPFRIFRYI
jgi:hypothetical protein